MERTNYLDKAKRLMMQTARTTALVIVPLAAAVTSAHAGAIVVAGATLPTGSPACGTLVSFDEISGSCSFNVSPISGGVLTGVSFSSQSGGINLFSSGSGTDTLSLSVSGILSGTLPSSLPLDFLATVTNAPSSGSWSVLFELDDSVGSVFTTRTFAGLLNAGSNTLSGSANLPITPSQYPSGSTVTEKVTFQWAVNSGTSNITFPFNFDAVQSTATPEPASLGGVTAGLGLFGWLFRRRRKKA